MTSSSQQAAMSSSSPVPTMPHSHTAIVVNEVGKLAVRHDIPVPSIQAGVAMVKTAAVAINPVDGKMLEYSPQPGTTHGYDFSGSIVALGENVPGHLKVGDRVAGTVHGMNPALPSVGAFAGYIAAPADLLLKIPDDMTFEEGASIGLGLFTAGLGLFQELKVPGSLDTAAQAIENPFKSDFVLVAGGATATGTRAIQLLKCAGLRPIATCSPSNFDLCRRFGAEEVFDYHKLECADEIRAYTKNSLAYVFDCVAMADTTQLCYHAMGRAGGRYVTLEPFREAITSTRPYTIKPSWILALTIFGHEVTYGGEYSWEAKPDDRTFGQNFIVHAQRLLDEGKLQAHPIRAENGGWEAVIQGVEQVRKEAMSGQKLVYVV